ncbi:hypothetical protein MPSEU_000054400 [Mayamaea pseudoterrestris]|nr:hypothetical protein MPSEU_000054400 [Mayamaea pseudoterrestris]
MSAAAATKQIPGALIFLHGLGDSPSGWSHLQRSLAQLRPRLAELTYIFPAAPMVAISINGGARMPGWFDLLEWPVSVGDPEDEAGLKAAVTQLHDEISKLEESGVPKSRIVVGGFSQGAAVALLAAYHAGVQQPNSSPLAGVVALSGWLTMTNDLQVFKDIAKHTPCWWGHGTYDDKVLYAQQAFGAGKLKEHKVNVSTTSYPMGHESCAEEMDDLAAFLDETLFGAEQSEL